LDSLSQARTLGGLGSILVILGVVPAFGFVIAIVGAILVLIAIKQISDSVGDKQIFENMIISVILSIVGIVAGAVLISSSIFTFFLQPYKNIGGIIAAVLIGLALIWVFFLISAIFLRKSYNAVAAKLNVGLFRTTALLYLIGAALTIVLVGFVVIFVADILQIVAFFSIPEAKTSSPATTTDLQQLKRPE
jgi:uncharacterized membrane protein